MLASDFVPLDVLILAPFGALAGALVGPPMLALTLLAHSLFPDALCKAFTVARDSKRIGPFAKILLQFLLHRRALDDKVLAPRDPMHEQINCEFFHPIIRLRIHLRSISTLA